MKQIAKMLRVVGNHSVPFPRRDLLFMAVSVVWVSPQVTTGLPKRC
ncbi:MAG: hypothetical protein SPM02_03320 [Bacteroidales bacterium]|nr:hypothetical protein [Bacteroidales bacterium]